MKTKASIWQIETVGEIGEILFDGHGANHLIGIYMAQAALGVST